MIYTKDQLAEILRVHHPRGSGGLRIMSANAREMLDQIRREAAAKERAEFDAYQRRQSRQWALTILLSLTLLALISFGVCMLLSAV